MLEKPGNHTTDSSFAGNECGKNQSPSKCISFFVNNYKSENIFTNLKRQREVNPKTKRWPLICFKSFVHRGKPVHKSFPQSNFVLYRQDQSANTDICN